MTEEEVWEFVSPNDIWVLDKLILSRKLGYICGPVGTNVPRSGQYIVRPCVNALGLGLGSSYKFIQKSTDYLPYGFFWCEVFEGRHLSVDFKYGKQSTTVEGFKDEWSLTRWNKWKRVDDVIQLPEILHSFRYKYDVINCEFIGNKLIEVHFRHNMDFDYDNDEFIPVWDDQSVIPPSGYRYIEYPDIHGRIGAFVR